MKGDFANVSTCTQCDQIIADEDDHVAFQSQRLAILRRRRPRWVIAWIHVSYRAFFWVTAAVVYLGHAPVFRAAGMRPRDFRDSCRDRLEAALGYMDPRQLEAASA